MRLSAAELEILTADRAVVAQRCTGRAKRPVFLLREAIVKGPWRAPVDLPRVRREIGSAALMRQWAPEGVARPVLQPEVLEHRGALYLVTPALYAPWEGPWPVAVVARSASAVGPRTLEVVDRAALGVERVSDRARRDPGYLRGAFEIWPHLVCRAILGSGDSGLHNMLVDPGTDKAVGVDLDERRGEARGAGLMGALFKAPPARRLWPHLEAGLEAARPRLEAWTADLEARLSAPESLDLARRYGLDSSAWSAWFARVRDAGWRL